MRIITQGKSKSMTQMLEEGSFVENGAYLDANANIVLKPEMHEADVTFTFLDGWKINVIKQEEGYIIKKSPSNGMFEEPLKEQGE